MNISLAGLAALKEREGLRLKAYPDPATGGEPWTIGYGHTGGVTPGMEITLEQAEDYLLEDLGWVYACIDDRVGVPLSQGEFDALCSLIFNIGGGAFNKSTLLRKLNAGDRAGAANEFPRWNMAAGRVNAVLNRRRRDERAQFLAELGQEAPIATTPIPTQPPAPAKAPAAPEPPAPDWRIPAGEAPDWEPPQPSPPTPEKPAMGPFVIPAIVELAKAIPKLGGLFATSEVAQRNVKAAEVVLGAVLPAVGAANAQEAAEMVRADPTAAVAAARAVDQVWFELVPADGGGVDGARKADASRDVFWYSASFWMGVLLLPLVYLIVLNLIGLVGTATWSPEARAGLAGMITGSIVGGLVGYYYGFVTSRNRSGA